MPAEWIHSFIYSSLAYRTFALLKYNAIIPSDEYCKLQKPFILCVAYTPQYRNGEEMRGKERNEASALQQNRNIRKS